MDGVLVDGEPLHFEAVNRVMATEGKSISLDAYKPYMGTKTGWSDMIRDYGMSQPLEHYAAVYRDMMVESYGANAVALPGAVSLVNGLRQRGVTVGLASSSIRPWVDACLRRIGLADAFVSVTSGTDVQEGKPSPEIYLLAAKRLGVDPARCLAFEDAPAGILSAKAAGMECWAVRTEYTRGLPLPDPHREFESLTSVAVEEIVRVAA